MITCMEALLARRIVSRRIVGDSQRSSNRKRWICLSVLSSCYVIPGMAAAFYESNTTISYKRSKDVEAINENKTVGIIIAEPFGIAYNIVSPCCLLLPRLKKSWQLWLLISPTRERSWQAPGLIFGLGKKTRANWCFLTKAQPKGAKSLKNPSVGEARRRRQ